MMEDDMKRNGSGYIDETPVKSGVLTGPQPGEIWEDTNGRLFLILKNQSGYSNVLAMQGNTAHDDNIAIHTELGIFFVNPGMVRFLLGRDKGRYIYTIPLEKHLEIMEAVSERLGVTIKVTAGAAPIPDAASGGEDLLGECARLECRLDEWKEKCSALETERDALQAELKDSEEMYHLACKTCNEEKAARKTAEGTVANIHNAYTQAEEKAAMWEKMYNALLDRLFARGEAK